MPPSHLKTPPTGQAKISFFPNQLILRPNPYMTARINGKSQLEVCGARTKTNFDISGTLPATFQPVTARKSIPSKACILWIRGGPIPDLLMLFTAILDFLRHTRDFQPAYLFLRFVHLYNSSSETWPASEPRPLNNCGASTKIPSPLTASVPSARQISPTAVTFFPFRSLTCAVTLKG